MGFGAACRPRNMFPEGTETRVCYVSSGVPEDIREQELAALIAKAAAVADAAQADKPARSARSFRLAAN